MVLVRHATCDAGHEAGVPVGEERARRIELPGIYYSCIQSSASSEHPLSSSDARAGLAPHLERSETDDSLDTVLAMGDAPAVVSR